MLTLDVFEEDQQQFRLFGWKIPLSQASDEGALLRGEPAEAQKQNVYIGSVSNR